jgi:GNAT superfamily N-acetyltransferase
MAANEALVAVRDARPADLPHLLRCIEALAVFEQLEAQLDLDPERLREHLFGAVPACRALIAELAGQAVGFALYFTSYSTFRTRPCLWLEDLFVLPEHRGHGAGLALLRAVAAAAVRLGCPRLDWSVLDWNRDAIRFYERCGAQLLADWRICRLDGPRLRALAEA